MVNSDKVRALRCVMVFLLVLTVSGSLVSLSDKPARSQTTGEPVPKFVWAEQFGTEAADNARSVGVDPSDGSPVVAGSTNGALDPTGSPDPTQPNLSAGGEDVFLRKHDRDGTKKWTRQFGSPLSDTAHDVAVAPDGSVYVAGYGNPAGRDRAGAYVAKYTPEGNLARIRNADGTEEPWIRQFNAGRIWTFALDPQGNVFIAVSINSDVYMYKLDPQGAFEASEPFGAYGCYGSAYLDIAFGSAVGRSSDPSVYVTGETTGYLDNPNDCRLNTGRDELFLIKFDGALNKKWHTQFGNVNNNLSGQAMGVAVDSQDNSYVVGHTNDVVFDPSMSGQRNRGGRDFFLAKFASGGSIMWGKQFGTTGNESAWDVAVDSEDKLYVVGNTDGVFEEEFGSGGTDAFVGKYDTLGDELAVRQFGTAGFDSARGVVHDDLTDSVLIAGNTDGALDGNQNTGSADGFLVKMRSETLDAGPPSDAKPQRPLIFVPGIAGTRLHYAATVDIGEEKWPRTTEYLLNPGLGDPRLLDLRLAEDGIRPFDNPYEPRYETSVGDIIRSELTQDVYTSTISRLEDAGYEEGVNFFPFPVDWRKHPDNAKGGSALYEDLPEDVALSEFIDYVREKNALSNGDLPKVDILAHSQGGLFTYDTLRKDSNVGKVNKVVTLGTPFLGSTKALFVLQYRAGCFPGPYPTTEETCYLDPATLQEAITNVPGIYDLLPSRQFQAVEGSPLYMDVDYNSDGAPDGFKDYGFWTGLDGNQQLYDNISYERNPGLMSQADEWHRQMDDLYLAPPKDPDVEAVRIVGDSLATPDYVRKYIDYSNCSFFDVTDCPTEYEGKYSAENRVEGGDGTVALHSADLYDPAKGFDLRGEAPQGEIIPNYYAHNVEHGALARDASSLGFAIGFFREDPQSQAASAPNSDFFSLRAANAESVQTSSPDELDQLAQANGLDTDPESFAGIEIAVSGSASGFISDDAGNRLGSTTESPGDSIVNEISGGDYNRIGSNQSFFINDAVGTYKIKLQTTGNENVELQVRAYEQGRLVEQTLFDAGAGNGSVLELGFAAGGGQAEVDPRMLIDASADGTVDSQVAPETVVAGSAASEIEPPTTTAMTELVVLNSPRQSDVGEDDRVGRPRPTNALVTLSAEDDLDGSGVAQIFYEVEGDAQRHLYEEPFEVLLGKVVNFASTDKVGNVETPKEILVDDAPSTQATAEPISSRNKLLRHLDSPADEDWFVFEADGEATYRVKLNGLPADYDLEVYDEEGNRVAAPDERGRRPEEVRERFASGRYFVKVSGHEGEWDADRPYRLSHDRLGPLHEGGGRDQ